MLYLVVYLLCLNRTIFKATIMEEIKCFAKKNVSLVTLAVAYFFYSVLNCKKYMSDSAIHYGPPVKYIHKQSACWVLTDRNVRLSNNKLSRVIQSSRKDDQNHFYFFLMIRFFLQINLKKLFSTLIFIHKRFIVFFCITLYLRSTEVRLFPLALTSSSKDQLIGLI